MRKIGILMALSLFGCTTDSQVRSAIAQDPDKFADSLRDAEAKKADDRMEYEFTHPLAPLLNKDRAFKGDWASPITIVEYSDFQCPYCARAFGVMEQVFKAYPGKIRFAYKHFPLTSHPLAMPAAKRFEAIALQSHEKAYEFHDEVYRSQFQLEGEETLDAIAKQVGVNLKKMRKDMESNLVLDHIQADMREVENFDFRGTPCFVVEGVSLRGAYPFETFKRIIDRKLATKK